MPIKIKGRSYRIQAEYTVDVMYESDEIGKCDACGEDHMVLCYEAMTMSPRITLPVEYHTAESVARKLYELSHFTEDDPLKEDWLNATTKGILREAIETENFIEDEVNPEDLESKCNVTQGVSDENRQNPS